MNKLKQFFKKFWQVIKKIWKYIDIGFVIFAIVLGVIVMGAIAIFSKRRIKKNVGLEYVKKMQSLLKEKIKNEKIINNSSYSDYNDNGTIRSRKRKKKSRNKT